MPVEKQQDLCMTQTDGVVLVYDRTNECLVSELVDYALVKLDQEQIDPKSLAQESHNIISFLEFIKSSGIDLRRVTSKTLISFRDSQLQKVLNSQQSINDTKAAKRTVNSKLRNVYRWLLWLQESKRLDPATIGTDGCEIECAGNWRSLRQPRERQTGRAYPLLYRGTGVGSKHTTRFVPTEDELDSITRALVNSSSNEFLRTRDVLFSDIARETGFRLASINSLSVEQFSRARIESINSETFLLSPSNQKFGYTNQFDFPTHLALFVCDFIDGPRKELIDTKQATVATTQNRIFLSSTTAKPMTNRALSRIVSNVMRRIGAPKGNAAHVFRRYYINWQIDEEIDRRLLSGMDTSTRSICLAVSLKVGHKDIDSIWPYVVKAQSARGLEARALQKREIEKLREELDFVRRERDALRSELDLKNSQ